MLLRPLSLWVWRILYLHNPALQRARERESVRMNSWFRIVYSLRSKAESRTHRKTNAQNDWKVSLHVLTINKSFENLLSRISIIMLAHKIGHYKIRLSTKKKIKLKTSNRIASIAVYVFEILRNIFTIRTSVQNQKKNCIILYLHS